MKTTHIILTALLIAPFAAGQALATDECIDQAPAHACGSQDEYLDVWADGVGGAYAYNETYSFWGNTYHYRGVIVWLHPASPVGGATAYADWGCSDAGSDGDCDTETHVLNANTHWMSPLGYHMVNLRHTCEGDNGCESDSYRAATYMDDIGYTMVNLYADRGEACTYSSALGTGYECTPLLP